MLAHLVDNARAFERQARFALRGETVAMYDGGSAGRDASIERGAALSSAELRDRLREAHADLDAVWRECGPADWARPVRLRNMRLVDTVLARWRETEIHAADLDLGYAPTDWPADFCAHAHDFLAERVPASIRLVLRADDADYTRVMGGDTAAEAVEISGALSDLTAWLAGRAPVGPLAVAGGELPELDPWPSIR